MSITIYYDRSYAFGTVLEYAIGSCTWHRVYEIYPPRPRAADQFPISQNSRLHERCLAARRSPRLVVAHAHRRGAILICIPRYPGTRNILLQ